MFDTTARNTPLSIALTQLLSVLAELERNAIIARTREDKPDARNFLDINLLL